MAPKYSHIFVRDRRLRWWPLKRTLEKERPRDGISDCERMSRTGSLRKRAAHISASEVRSDASFLSVMDVSAMLIAEDIAALVGIKPSLPSMRLNRLSVDYRGDRRTDNLLLTPPGWYGSTYIPTALFLNL